MRPDPRQALLRGPGLCVAQLHAGHAGEGDGSEIRGRAAGGAAACRPDVDSGGGGGAGRRTARKALSRANSL